MAERPSARGMGRGLAAILSRARPPPRPGADAPSCASCPVELIAPNPRQPRRRFDEDALAGARRARSRERGVAAAGARAPAARRDATSSIAGERRWRAAQLAGLEPIPALVREHDDADVARARADREHGARGPQPGRGGARLRRARRGARAHARGGRPARRPQPRRGLEPAAPARPARRGARAARARRAHRGPRPRAAARRRPRRRAAASPASAAAEGWSVRDARGARAARRRRRRAPTPRPRPRRRRCIPTRRRRSSAIADALGARARRARSACARAARGYRVELAFDVLDEALELAAPARARARSSARAGPLRYTRRSPGRLAQSVRALL